MAKNDMFWLYLGVIIFGLFIAWFAWWVFIKSIPPIKVEIVNKDISIRCDLPSNGDSRFINNTVYYNRNWRNSYVKE